MSVRVAVVGATGLVGQELLGALSEAAQEGELDLAPPLVLATGRAAGETFPWIEEDEELVLEPFSAENAREARFALVAVAPEAAGGVVETLRKLGVTSVDVSRAHRETSPLYFDRRPPPLAGATVVALPSVEALLVGRVVEAVRGLGPVRVGGTLLRPASAAGQAGVGDLAEAAGRLLNGQEPEAPALGHRLAFNLVPQAGAFEGAHAQAELDLEAEVRRLVGEPALQVWSTVGYAPWFHGHFAALELQFGAAVTEGAVRAALEGGPGVKLLDDTAQAVYPMPSLATGDSAVLVGRVRGDRADATRVHLVAAVDGLRATAVLAVEALGALVRAGRTH
jgi:aspartate-semialdehyde dehydrogenase